jgi:hypothetical protein
MDCGLLAIVRSKLLRVVPDTPEVKSAKTCKLFNAGVSRRAVSAKTVDPIVYDVGVG